MTEQTKDLVDQAATEVVADDTVSANTLLLDVIKLSMDPTVDGEKTTALANLAMKMQDREAERRFRMAKHNAISQMPSISKSGAVINHKTNMVQSRYSKFEDIDRVVRPILQANRLILTFNVNHEGQMVTVQPLLSYSDGEMAFEEKGGEMVLAVDTTGAKNATQGAGSAASYGKRHSMKAMLNIIEDGEDNDGQGGVELTEDHKKLIEEGRNKAREGTDAYKEWFQGLDQGQQGFLGYTPGPDGVAFHQRNKEAAQAFD